MKTENSPHCYCVIPKYSWRKRDLDYVFLPRVRHGSVTGHNSYQYFDYRPPSIVLFSFQGHPVAFCSCTHLYITCNLFLDVRVADLGRKAVLITGCDSGFGYELAKKSLGLRVFATCLTSEGEEKLTNERSRELRTFKLDVAEASLEGLGSLGIEVVKSGLPSQGTVLELNLNVIDVS